jgi:cellulose synthase (UDP-forming)
VLILSKNKKIFKVFLIAVFFVSYVVYLYWRAVYTIPFQFGYLSIIFGVMLFIAEFVGFLESAIFYITLWSIETPTTPKLENNEYPDVDIFIATYNEPLELLYKTIIGCKNMDYPNKSKVHIYICDDGNRGELAKLTNRLRVGYITRTENTHAKAGNLNNALSKTESPYIVTFDADMIPMHDFLIKTIPFFLTGEKIGFVQVPQNFYNPDPFQYNLFSENNIPNEQNLFSRVIQAGRSGFNAAIYAGSNTVISRQALDEIGGLVVGTITEDFATGMMIQSREYKCIYLNEIHASGLSPETLEDLYNQRIRWGRGVVQTFKAFNPFHLRGLKIMQKIMYFSALSYWYFGIWRFIFLFTPILYSLFGIVVLYASAISILKIWLPMFLLTNITFRFFTNNIRTSSWSHIYDTIMFPQITKGVIMETFGVKMGKFKVTPKDKITRNTFVNSFELVWVQICLASLSLAGIIKISYSIITKNFEISYIINIFWMSYNLYLLVMAILFASERPKFRNSERLIINTKAVINGEKVVTGITSDISETGVSIILDKPIYLNPDIIHPIEIITEKNSSKCLTKLIRIDNVNDKYKYVFNIVKIDEINYKELIIILYDRVPFLPDKLKNYRIYKSIERNINSRRKKFSPMNRKLPRIKIDKEFIAYSEEGAFKVNISDFNFMYCAIKSDKQYKKITIPLGYNPELQLTCKLDEGLTKKSARGLSIYVIDNYKQLVNSDEIIQRLLDYNLSNYSIDYNIVDSKSDYLNL